MLTSNLISDLHAEVSHLNDEIASMESTVEIVIEYKDKIIEEVNSLLTDVNKYKVMSSLHNPYGDGKACQRIVEFIKGKCNYL